MPLNCVGEKYNQLFKEYTGLDMNELSRETNSVSDCSSIHRSWFYQDPIA